MDLPWITFSLNKAINKAPDTFVQGSLIQCLVIRLSVFFKISNFVTIFIYLFIYLSIYLKLAMIKEILGKNS